MRKFNKITAQNVYMCTKPNMDFVCSIIVWCVYMLYYIVEVFMCVGLCRLLNNIFMYLWMDTSLVRIKLKAVYCIIVGCGTFKGMKM